MAELYKVPEEEKILRELEDDDEIKKLELQVTFCFVSTLNWNTSSKKNEKKSRISAGRSFMRK